MGFNAAAFQERLLKHLTQEILRSNSWLPVIVSKNILDRINNAVIKTASKMIVMAFEVMSDEELQHWEKMLDITESEITNKINTKINPLMKNYLQDIQKTIQDIAKEEGYN